jgi:hypothetical protein
MTKNKKSNMSKHETPKHHLLFIVKCSQYHFITIIVYYYILPYRINILYHHYYTNFNIYIIIEIELQYKNLSLP